MHLLNNYPNHFKNPYILECLEINYSRMYYISKILIFMSLGMFVLSVVIHDDLAIQIINGGLFAGLLLLNIITLNKPPRSYTGHRITKQILIDFFYSLAILWGITMVGFNPDNPVVFFDITIVCILVAVFYITIYQKLTAYFGFAYGLLIWGTPYFSYSTDYLPLLIAPLLYMIICFYVSRILYLQVMEKFELSEALKERKKELEVKLDETSEVLENTEKNISRDIIKTLVKVLEYYDGYTKGHSENVANHAKDIAHEMGLSIEQQEALYVCGLVHDIGKILIPIHILNKPERLSKEEYDIISKHSQYGYEMLNESKHLSHIAKVVLHHHEHWDGKGYPNELKYDDIPLESQILMVADTWDAMCSERIYRRARTTQEAKSELLRCRGSQFSPAVVDAMLKIIET